MNYKKGIPRGYLFYFARRRLGYPFVISTLPPFVISTFPPFVISTNVEKSRSAAMDKRGAKAARLSESSISKTPTAYQWGQIPQPRCARQLPLLKGAPFGRPRFIVRFLDCARNDRWGERAAARRGVVEMTALVGRPCFPFLSFRPKRVARSGEISERQRRTKGEPKRQDYLKAAFIKLRPHISGGKSLSLAALGSSLC